MAARQEESVARQSEVARETEAVRGEEITRDSEIARVGEMDRGGRSVHSANKYQLWYVGPPIKKNNVDGMRKRAISTQVM